MPQPYEPSESVQSRHDARAHAMPVHPALVPKPLRSTDPPPSSQQPFVAKRSDASPQPSQTPNEADMDRFVMLFSPATPPATPTLMPTGQPPLVDTDPTVRPRKSTQGSADSDFGAFVSVPPSQDPLLNHAASIAPFAPASQSHAPIASPTPAHPNNISLVYFDHFTASAKSAAERNRREVLDELLHHQDDPMYFLNTHHTPSPSSATTSTLPAAPIPVLTSTDDALAEALASEMTDSKLIRGRSIRVAPSPSRARVPLPPRLSGSASPPSTSSPTGSSTSLPTSSPPLRPLSSASTSTSTLTSGSYPAHATLSRISSTFVSLLPSGRSRSAAPTSPPSSTHSAPTTISRFSSPFSSTALTHGSPFASTPYIPPTGAPGFAGDRAWDHGFSEVLERDEKCGLVDPVGLGSSIGIETTGHTRHVKGKGVTLVGRWEGTMPVLNEEIADLLRPHLPALTKLPRHWALLYSLDQNGISLNTLYSRCEPRIPSRAHPNPPKGGLLAVQDAHDAVFGAWLSEGIILEKGGYYGSGESFLWRYYPPLDGERQGRLEVYNWTGVNEYVALCEPGFISFGGGDGHYGLYLDASLLDGSSAPCPTFGNPPLCVPAPRASTERTGGARIKGDVSFECVGLEVWGIGQG